MKAKIYQINLDLDYNSAACKGLKKKVDSSIYALVYPGDLHADDLEEIFTLLNLGDKPKGYHGRSLSVSDVVEIDSKFYYCDIIGFSEIEFDPSKVAKAKRIKEIETRRRSYAVIGFDGINYEADYIADHINEFQEALKDGSGPYDFERHCNVSDALGHYCDILDYHGIYQILLRIYDDEDQIDEILLNLKPDSEEAQLIRERYQEEIVDGE